MQQIKKMMRVYIFINVEGTKNLAMQAAKAESKD